MTDELRAVPGEDTYETETLRPTTAPEPELDRREPAEEPNPVAQGGRRRPGRGRHRGPERAALTPDRTGPQPSDRRRSDRDGRPSPDARQQLLARELEEPVLVRTDLVEVHVVVAGVDDIPGSSPDARRRPART